MSPLPFTPAPVRERYDIDRATFEGEIVPAYEPVLLKGLVKDWPAVAAATDPRATAEYLVRFDSGRPLGLFAGDPSIGGRFFYTDDLSGFNFQKHEVPLRPLLAELLAQADRPDPPAIYAGAAAEGAHAPGFSVANPMPLVDRNVVARLWIGNNTVVSTHYDLGGNIACVVAGRRRFLLFPPDQLANLYVGPLERTMAGQPVSMVDPEAPDLDRYPRFAEAMRHAHVAELEPGDAIYVPSLWWHHVRASGPLNLLVNYWWGERAEGSAFEVLVHGLLAVRDLPAAERAAWRGIFDHYLFQNEIDPAGHLPPAARGILGPASAERTRMIQGFLLNALGRR